MDSKQRVWESLRNDARQTDALIERKLNALETAARVGFEGSSNGREFKSADDGSTTAVKLDVARREFNRQRSEIDMALQRFESLLDTMAETARALPPDSAAQTHTDRFQQLVAEKRHAVLRISTDFKRRLEWAELLPTVKSELEIHKSSAGVRLLIEEQDSLRHTQRRLNHILDQADSTQGQLRGQRDAFLRMGDRVSQIANRIPLVKKVLARIDSKRRRDAVILGGVIGVCLLLMVLFR